MPIKVKIPIIIEIEFNKNDISVENKTEILEKVLSLYQDAPTIVRDTIKNVDKNLITFKEVNPLKLDLTDSSPSS